MIRRDFLKAAAACSALYPFGSFESVASIDSKAISAGCGAAPIMSSFTVQDHRQRLLNIAACERNIHTCLRKQLITGYIPGQAAYGVGEYPNRKPYSLGDEYDEQVLDRLYDDGIRLIQIMEEWNDILRLFGGNKFTAVNSTGLRRFIHMAQHRGIKVLIYASTGYMQYGDPDLQNEWVTGLPNDVLNLAWWRLVRCSPASPGWRAYLLPRILRVLDEYGPDGLYNDWGYRNLATYSNPPAKDQVLAFQETKDHDAALEDLISIIHSEVKRRGGIYKMHCDNTQPQFKTQLYDYLWVGEGISSADQVRLMTKTYPPYVVPCFDFGSLPVSTSEDEPYLQAIPYLQFPLRQAGRPYTGEKVTVPGVQYHEDAFFDRLQAIWKYTQEHPDGPFMYGQWDAFPPRRNRGEIHAQWLKQYSPLVQEGTWAYVEISDSDLFVGSVPPDIVATVYANRELYLVLANYGTQDVSIKTAQLFVVSDDDSGLSTDNWQIPARSLKILRRIRSGEVR